MIALALGDSPLEYSDGLNGRVAVPLSNCCIKLFLRRWSHYVVIGKTVDFRPQRPVLNMCLPE